MGPVEAGRSFYLSCFEVAKLLGHGVCRFEDIDPIVLHEPPRKKVAFFGAVHPCDGIMITPRYGERKDVKRQGL